MRSSLLRGVGVGLVALACALPVGAGGEDKPASFTFRASPTNSLGVRSLADLRGKPVLIDFWGTR